MRKKNCVRRLLALFLSLALLALAGCAVGERPSSAAAVTDEPFDGLEVTVLDAGKADAILLTTAESAVLIDAGEKGFGKTILAYLEEQGVEKLDYLIVTHFDKDHVGGAAKVINNISVGTVLQSNSPKDSDEYEKYVKALANAGIEPVTVRETLTFTLGGVTYTVDPPVRETYADDPSNNSSLIVSVVNGADSFLFTGDAQTARLAELLDGDVSGVDVLKLPHHGQDEPLLDALLSATRPAYAVITSSDEEPESAATVAALERAGATVLLTRNGAVTLRSGGNGVQVLEE